MKADESMKKPLWIFSYLLVTFSVIAFIFSSGVSATSVSKKAEAKNQDEVRVYIEAANTLTAQHLENSYDPIWTFDNNGFTANVTEEEYETLAKKENVEVRKLEKITLDYIMGDKNLTAVDEQTPWGIKAIYNDEEIDETTGGENIRIAVLDTGVNEEHEDLKNRVEACQDFTNGGSCSDGNGHGTHVAGTVLADAGETKDGIYGVAPNANLWAYKVLTDEGSGYPDDIAVAIRQAADEGEKQGVNVIISMSLGSSNSDPLIEEAVQYATDHHALVIAAAGNSGPSEGTIGYPAALVDAVSVAALEDVQENGTYRVADFSSRGYTATAGDYLIQEGDVEVSAPGADILSTWYDGTYQSISGTSMATPHVAGLAAKMWAENPEWSNSELRTELQERAKENDIKGGQSAEEGDDIASGFGFPTVESNAYYLQ